MNQDLRRNVFACFDAALAAVEPRQLVEDYLGSFPRTSIFADRGKIHLIAVGKAAAAMARGASSAFGDRLVKGLVIVPDGDQHRVPPRFEAFAGGHPIPNPAGAEGAAAIRDMAVGLGAADHLLVLISGGGSALMTLPPDDVPLADLQAMTQELLRCGARIDDINCVRKHLDELKGGGLARFAAPAEVLALVLSDVLADSRGERLDVIASGPLSEDSTRFDQAIGILDRFGIWESTTLQIREHLENGRRGRLPESPTAGDPCLERVTVEVIGNNRLAAEAALAEARRLGYESRVLTTRLSGEARKAGKELGAIAVEELERVPGSRVCLVAAGETTVTVRGSGRGGRNQELALAAALELDGVEDVVLASIGTDGIDGPTDAAGAIVDGTTLRRARELGLEPSRALDANDTYPVFSALDDLIITGPTGTNVMDIVLVLIKARGPGKADYSPRSTVEG